MSILAIKNSEHITKVNIITINIKIWRNDEL